MNVRKIGPSQACGFCVHSSHLPEVRAVLGDGPQLRQMAGPDPLSGWSQAVERCAELGRKYGPKREWLFDFLEMTGVWGDRPATAEDAIDLAWVLGTNADHRKSGECRQTGVSPPASSSTRRRPSWPKRSR